MKKIAITLILLLVLSGYVSSFSFDLIKVLNLLSNISDSTSEFSSKIDDYYKEFMEFYKEKWAKYYEKLSFEEIKKLDTWNVDEIYKGSKIDSDNMEKKWKTIFRHPEEMEREFPYLFDVSHYRDNPEYASNIKFRKSIDEDIEDGFEYLKRIKSLITLLKNTRKSQKIRGKKVVKLKKYIKNFSMPKGRDEVRMGRLIGLEVIIDYEIEKQLVEYISLINVQTEIDIRSTCMSQNMKNRNYISRSRGIGIEKRIRRKK